MIHRYISLKVQRDGVDQEWGYYTLCRVDDTDDEILQEYVKIY